MRLTQRDYITILDYYNEDIPKTRRNKPDAKKIRDVAENILASKLCRCIKKVDRPDESEAIGICTKSIFTDRGIKYDAFRCKPAYTLLRTRKNRRSLGKTRKVIRF